MALSSPQDRSRSSATAPREICAADCQQGYQVPSPELFLLGFDIVGDVCSQRLGFLLKTRLPLLDNNQGKGSGITHPRNFLSRLDPGHSLLNSTTTTRVTLLAYGYDNHISQKT